jgi:hypothetical protein
MRADGIEIVGCSSLGGFEPLDDEFGVAARMVEVFQSTYLR